MKRLTHEISDPKEKLFIKQVLEYTHKAEVQNRSFFTDFYNGEWMRQTIKKHLGKEELIDCCYFGGYPGAERQMLGLLAEYDSQESFPISCLKIQIKTGLGKPLSHRDFLGALLGLGIERDTMGDIIVKPFGAYIIAKDSMIEYISYSLTGIGRYQSVEMTKMDLSALEVEPPEVKEIHATVASLRTDAVIAVGFGISRTTGLKLIQNDKATCNGVLVSQSYTLKEGDIMTLRGYGKIKLKAINGKTKKDRLHICIEKYI